MGKTLRRERTTEVHSTQRTAVVVAPWAGVHRLGPRLSSEAVTARSAQTHSTPRAAHRLLDPIQVMRLPSRILSRPLRISLIAALVPLLAVGAALMPKNTAHAEGAEADKAELNERCAVRLSIALLNKSAEPKELTSNDPQAAVDSMVASREFAEHFARFTNAHFNAAPTEHVDQDPVYALAKYVIVEQKPWADLFVGPYSFAVSGSQLEVKADPNGLGYFRYEPWLVRYAGNEDQGYLLSASFRLLQNTIDLELIPSVGVAGEDNSATGRQRSPCNGCHFDAWYALDKIARLLPRKKLEGEQVKMQPTTDGPQELLNKTVKDDKELVTSLVQSESWRFAQCRNVFHFLYGRAENQCESKVFDACVTALEEKKTIQSAVAAVAKDPSFCRN